MLHAPIYLFISIYISVYLSINIYISIYISIYIYIYIYIIYVMFIYMSLKTVGGRVSRPKTKKTWHLEIWLRLWTWNFRWDLRPKTLLLGETPSTIDPTFLKLGFAARPKSVIDTWDLKLLKFRNCLNARRWNLVYTWDPGILAILCIRFLTIKSTMNQL